MSLNGYLCCDASLLEYHSQFEIKGGKKENKEKLQFVRLNHIPDSVKKRSHNNISHISPTTTKDTIWFYAEK